MAMKIAKIMGLIASSFFLAIVVLILIFLKRQPTELHLLTMGTARFSPSQDIIVFSYRSTNYNGIFLMDYQGHVFRWLCKDVGGAGCSSPCFSPDGKQIAFSHGKSLVQSDIYIMDIDGANLRCLTSDAGASKWPMFSLDGRRIYFLRYPADGCYPMEENPCSHKADIYCIDLFDGGIRPITKYEFKRFFHYASLPRDRLLISAWVAAKDENILWEIDANNPSLRRAVRPNMARFAQNSNVETFIDSYSYLDIKNFCVSHDGEYMAFAWRNPSTGLSQGQQTFVTNLRTMETEQLTNFRGATYPLSISVKGNKLLINSGYGLRDEGYTAEHPSELWLFNLDGPDARNLTLDFTKAAHERPIHLFSLEQAVDLTIVGQAVSPSH